MAYFINEGKKVFKNLNKKKKKLDGGGGEGGGEGGRGGRAISGSGEDGLVTEND